MSLSLSASPWLLLLAAPGFWLAWRLYARSSSLPPFRRRLLAGATVIAWCALAALCVRPFLGREPEVFHPPVVVLAEDRSASYAALGAAEAAARGMAAARSHYEALGFKVLSFGFGEAVDAAGAGTKTPSARTDFAALREAIDSLSLPNLQGVLVWTDGRFDADAEEGGGADWTAPVFPVVPPPRGGEVQGERVDADFSDPDSGAVVTVAWRSAGSVPGPARLELRAGSRIVWSGDLPASGAPGVLLTREFRVPASRVSGSDPEAWIALVRPAAAVANVVAQNDTVSIRFRGLRRRLQRFVRPVASLEDRGLIDALRADTLGLETIALSPEGPDSPQGASPNGGAPSEVRWVRADSPDRDRVLAAARVAGEPVVVYAFPSVAAENGRAVFSGDARLGWRDEGRGFLPDAVLRLADLGAASWTLRSPGADAVPLAWADEDGRRGLLLWRLRGSPSVFGCAVPPLWADAFRPDADDRARGPARAWVRGIAEWARTQGITQVTLPDPAVAGRPFPLELRLPLADDAGTGSRAYDLIDSAGRVLSGAEGARTLRFAGVSLPAGLRPVRAVERASRVPLWSGVLRVRAPLDVEMARLGVDREALDSLALATRGRVLTAEDSAWPELPRASVRESRPVSLPLTPPIATALGVALLFCAVWALRKKLRLD